MVYANGNSDVSIIARLADRHSRAVEESILRYHGEMNGYAAAGTVSWLSVGFVGSGVGLLIREKPVSAESLFSVSPVFSNMKRCVGLPGVSRNWRSPMPTRTCSLRQRERWPNRETGKASSGLSSFLLNFYSPMVQAVLTPAIRRHAVELCETAVQPRLIPVPPRVWHISFDCWSHGNAVFRCRM